MIRCSPKHQTLAIRSYPNMRQVALVVACLAWGVVAMPEPPVSPGQFSPTPQYGAAAGRPQQAGYPSANSNNGYGDDSDYEDANYEFKYDVEEQESSLKFGHQEARQGAVATGHYYVLLPDGRTQMVEYTADQDGYHPKVTYQDPRDQGYGSGSPSGQNGYSNNEGAAGSTSGYSNGGSAGGYPGRNGGAASGQRGYSSNGSPSGSGGYSTGGAVGGYPGSSGPAGNGGYSR